jgi:hypothetical protein
VKLIPTADGRRVWLGRFAASDEFRSPARGEYALLLVVGDGTIDADAQARWSEQFVRTGCRYAVCFGPTSSSWDDSIDMVGVMDEIDGRPGPFVMTTWHDHEPLEQTVDFFARDTRFDDWSPEEFVVVVLGGDEHVERRVLDAVERGFGSTPRKQE